MHPSSAYVKILLREFRSRADRNSLYSLRAFARDAGLSAAQTSQILAGKKGISAKAALKVSENLGLSLQERDLVVASATVTHSRSKKSQALAAVSLRKLTAKHREIKRSKNNELAVANKWLHYAFLELLEHKNASSDIHWLAKKLGVSSTLIKSIVRDLIGLGWINETQGRFQSNHLESDTTSDEPSRVIRELHQSFLNKAEQSLQLDPVTQREFINMTFAFSQTKLADAKEELRRFQLEFAEKFYDTLDAKDSVYQLSIQFFRLDKKDGSDD